MRVGIGHLKVGMKFRKTESGKVLEVTSVGDDGVVYYAGGEVAVSRLNPSSARPVWLVDAPAKAAPAPAPAPKVEEAPKPEMAEAAEVPKPKKKKAVKPVVDAEATDAPE